MSVPEIDVDTLAALLADGPTLIDVRQPDEYQEAHVPGALLIPLGDLPDRLADVPVDQPVYLICHSGGRSGRAAEYLAGQGRDVTNVAGGTAAWIASGEHVAEGDDPH